MRRLLLITTGILISQFVIAQYHETIRTARPGQAFGPFTTGKNVFQIQTGLTYADFENTDVDQQGDNLEYTASLRYGILESFEVRSAFRLRHDKITLADESSLQLNGLSFWNVGVRYNIVESDGYKPSFGFQADVKLTWVNKDYQSQEIAPRLLLIHTQKLSETFGITTNWSVSWNGNDNLPKGSYVINTSFPIAGNLSSFIENYGEVYNGNFETR